MDQEMRHAITNQMDQEMCHAMDQEMCHAITQFVARQANSPAHPSLLEGHPSSSPTTVSPSLRATSQMLQCLHLVLEENEVQHLVKMEGAGCLCLLICCPHRLLHQHLKGLPSWLVRCLHCSLGVQVVVQLWVHALSSRPHPSAGSSAPRRLGRARSPSSVVLLAESLIHGDLPFP